MCTSAKSAILLAAASLLLISGCETAERLPRCGNGIIEPGETCDGNCPASCVDGNDCTADSMQGSVLACTAICINQPINECQGGDGCCPVGCNSSTDGDCSATCGNGVVEAGETCDGNCPADCNDGNACTVDTMNGSAQNCNAACVYHTITSCTGGDGCCPAGCNKNSDSDCSASCGNGMVEEGETCDGNCPADCNDGNACTVDSMTGSPQNCNVACGHQSIVECLAGDGCCPAGCNANTDSDCSASCGNGVVEAGETCDGDCPSNCNDGNACTIDTMTGSANNCNTACSYQMITECTGGDVCCPAGCNNNNDQDCSTSCGNGVVEYGETCDGNCPTECIDGNACTIDTMTGSPQTCSAACNFQPITQCANGDGCCAPGCNSNNDSECSPSCGNGVVEHGETCDGDCPDTCDDGNSCTIDNMTGSAENCNVACSYQTITQCIDDDQCCPAGCNNRTDNDCSPTCGNGVIEEGETCDGNCPFNCNDNNACTIDIMTGSAVNCNVVCSHQPITECTDGDGCCPAGCNSSDDNDCFSFCGNSEVEPGEDCDSDNLNNTTCPDLGYTGGTLACRGNCTFDVSGCTGCLDDMHEENDDQSNATGLTAGLHDLMLCDESGGEEDWFFFDLLAGESLGLVVDYNSGLHSLEIWILDDVGTILAYSDTPDDHEELLYSAGADMTVYILVRSYWGAVGSVLYSVDLIPDPACTDHFECPQGELCLSFECVEYMCSAQAPCPDGLLCYTGMCVECISAGDCPVPEDFLCEGNYCVLNCTEDGYEPNSTSDEAVGVPVGFDQADLTLCGQYDNDWFTVDLEAMHNYDFYFAFSHIHGDVDGFLYAASDLGWYLESGQSTNDDESFSYAVPADQAGTYYIRAYLYPSGYAQTYALTVSDLGAIDCFTDAECDPAQICVNHLCQDPDPGDVCAAPIAVSSFPFTATDVDSSDFRPNLDFVSTSCTGDWNPGNDIVYQLDLTLDQSVDLTLTSDFDASLYVVSDCSVSPMPESVCVAGTDIVWSPGTEILSFTADPAGIYYVVVDSYSTLETGLYTLEINLP